MALPRPPDFLPSHVLVHPEFEKACAERDLGTMFRVAKQRGGVGFTASHLARRCDLTVARVQDYVNGRIAAQRVEIFERVADALHVPGAMLHLAPRPWEDQGLSDAGAVPTVYSDEGGEQSVLRRDFMRLGAGIVATGAVAGLPGVPSPTGGNRVGETTVAEISGTFARLRRLDDHLGGADTYGIYVAEVERTAAVLAGTNSTAATKRVLLALLAEQAQQAGWAAFDAGWHDAARNLYQRSFEAARESGDLALAGNALALRSYQLLTLGTVTTDLTDKACSIAARDVHPAVKSLLYQRGAWTYAVAGQAEQTARALGHAEEALAQGGQANSGPDWAMWSHDATELQIMIGRCWTQLHRPLRAVPALEAAMARYDDSHARDKALYLTSLADAYLDAREPDPAVAVLNTALNLAGGVASARPAGRIKAVMGRLEDHQTVPGVADLLVRRPVDPVQVWR